MSLVLTYEDFLFESVEEIVKNLKSDIFWDKYTNKITFPSGTSMKLGEKNLASNKSLLRGAEFYLRKAKMYDESNVPMVELLTIETPVDKRGQGAAKEAINTIIQIANKYSVILYLECIPFGNNKDMSPYQLMKFYETFGFVAFSMGKNPKMIRIPLT